MLYGMFLILIGGILGFVTAADHFTQDREGLHRGFYGSIGWPIILAYNVWKALSTFVPEIGQYELRKKELAAETSVDPVITPATEKKE